MTKKRDITDAEKALWDEAVKDVTPIKPSRIVKKKAPVKPIAKARKTDSVMPWDTAPALPKVSIDSKTRQKIMSGEYKIDAKIDLHGFTLDNAYAALSQFIADHAAKGSRLLLVVTGKGQGGGLKDDVPRWLSFSGMANIVAYHTHAQPRHGGTGAIYVYLRRKR